MSAREPLGDDAEGHPSLAPLVVLGLPTNRTLRSRYPRRSEPTNRIFRIPHEIQILNHAPRARIWLSRAASFVVMSILPITIGVVLNSPAMQWLGFVFSILAILGLVHRWNVDTTFNTTHEARLFLDKIDRGEA